jgi:hypothetical protein
VLARGHNTSLIKIARATRLGQAHRFVGNNSLKAQLNTSAHGEHSSTSTENSDGIDPDYYCGGVVVRWRRILGSASRPLVKLT